MRNKGAGKYALAVFAIVVFVIIIAITLIPELKQTIIDIVSAGSG